MFQDILQLNLLFLGSLQGLIWHLYLENRWLFHRGNGWSLIWGGKQYDKRLVIAWEVIIHAILLLSLSLFLSDLWFEPTIVCRGMSDIKLSEVRVMPRRTATATASMDSE